MLLVWIIIALAVIIIVGYSMIYIAKRFKKRKAKERVKGPESDRISRKVDEVEERLNEVRRESPRGVDVSLEKEE